MYMHTQCQANAQTGNLTDKVNMYVYVCISYIHIYIPTHTYTRMNMHSMRMHSAEVNWKGKICTHTQYIHTYVHMCIVIYRHIFT